MTSTSLVALVFLAGLGWGGAIVAALAYWFLRKDLQTRHRLDVTGSEARPAPAGARTVVPDPEFRVRMQFAEASIQRGTEELMEQGRRTGRPLTREEASEIATRIYWDAEGGEPQA